MGSPYACLNIIVLDFLGGEMLTERYIVYSGGNSFLTLEEIQEKKFLEIAAQLSQLPVLLCLSSLLSSDFVFLSDLSPPM